jgi:Kef-type K+ transport system membrane component KefB
VVGTAVPFVLGVAISRLMYDKLIRTDPSMDGSTYSSFLVFIGVAMSITAFPVLARVLTETKLLASPAGSMTMGVRFHIAATVLCDKICRGPPWGM